MRALRPVLRARSSGWRCAFTVFALDVYMIDLTPHWSQRELVKRYYSERKSPKRAARRLADELEGRELLHAATASRCSSTSTTRRSPVDRRSNKGKRAFFMLEHGRLGRFKTLVGKRKV